GDFGRLASDNRHELLRERGVRSVRVIAQDGSDWLYDGRINVRLWELAVPAQRLDEVPIWRVDFPGLPLPPRGVEARVPMRGVEGPEGRPVTYAEAPSRFVLEPLSPAHRIEIDFGVVTKDGIAWNLIAADGIEFRISVNGSRETTILWTKTL